MDGKLHTVKMTKDTAVAFVSGDFVEQIVAGEKRVYIKTTQQHLTLSEIVKEGFMVIITPRRLGVFDKQHLDEAVV